MRGKISRKLKKVLLTASAFGMSASAGLLVSSAQAATYYTADSSNSTVGKVNLNEGTLGNIVLHNPQSLQTGNNEFVYVAVTFTPMASGTFAFGQTESQVDSIMVLYDGIYDPANPGWGAIVGNDDTQQWEHQNALGDPTATTMCGQVVNWCPLISANVQAGVTYTLWVSVYSSGYNDAFALDPKFDFYSTGDVVFGTYTGMTPIDLTKPYFEASELNNTVEPRFVGGTLRMDQSGHYNDSFELSSMASNTIDTYGHDSVFSGVFFDAAGQQGVITIDDSIGSGRATFTGANTYTGATQLKGGVLSVSQDANLGASSAKLVFDGGTLRAFGSFETDRDVEVNAAGGRMITEGNNTVTMNGAVSGTGNWSKLGHGVLSLNAANSYSGTLSVDNGTLVIGNSTAYASAAVAGDVVVGSGSTLAGFGRVGGNVTFADGAYFSPGADNAAGTFTVDGNLALNGATVFYNVYDDGTADHIAVAGTATVQNSKLAIRAGVGKWEQDQSYVVMEATGGVTGTFDKVVTNLAFLNPYISYSGDQVIMKLTRNDTSFSDITVGGTYNQRHTANALNSLSVDHKLIWAISQMDQQTALAAYDNLSGEVYGSTRSALKTNSRYLRDAINRRLLTQGTEPIWFDTWGHDGRTSGDGNASRTNNHGWGVALGLDGQLGDNAKAGLVLSYERTDVGNQRSSSSDVDAMHVGAYIGTEYAGLKLRGGMAYSHLDMSTSRNIWVFGPKQKLEDDYNGWQFQVFGEGSYDFRLSEAATISPYINLAHVWLNADGVGEHGGSAAALSVKGDTDSTTFTTLGLRGEVALGAPVSVYGDAGWQHAFGDVDGKTSNRFRGVGDKFSIKGVGVAEDTALVGAGVKAKINDNNQVTFGYQGQFGDDLNDHSANVQWQVKF